MEEMNTTVENYKPNTMPMTPYTMSRTDIINMFIEKRGYKTYLEIGVCDGYNLRMVDCPIKIGVDPEPLPSGKLVTTRHITSDEYFEKYSMKFDIIFVDGLHESPQVLKDIQNSLNCLNEGGVIICHDMNPRCAIESELERVTKIWNGDCWKAFAHLRATRTDLDMYVVNTDWGCGVIQKGQQALLDLKVDMLDYKYSDFEKNKKSWMNLIEVDDFLKKF